jgi:hypothetical protein
MTDQEATEAWATLSALLTKFNLEDILRRVEAYLHEGKLEEREIEQLEERSVGEGRLFHVEDFRRRPGRRSRYVAVAEYTAQERVYALTQAVLHAVIFPQQMEHEIWSYLEKPVDGVSNPITIQTIRIAHEIPEGEPRVATLRRQVPLNQLRELQQALQELSSEAQK